MEALFKDAGEVESAVTWVSIVILILSALSFTRALQKMYQRSYGTAMSNWREGWRGLAWLAGLAVWLVVSSPLRAALSDDAGVVLAIALSTVAGFALWLWTPAILVGEMGWRHLLPGALISAVSAHSWRWRPESTSQCS